MRLFLHHVNGVAGKKKLAVMLKNTDNLRPVHYKVTRSGAAGFAYDYMRDGKNSQKEYFDDSSQKPQEGKLGFGGSRELLSGRGIILPTDKLYTATVDLHFDKPVEVSVLMCEAKSDLELFNEAAAIQPMDEHPLRGTFEAADWNYTLKKPVKHRKNRSCWSWQPRRRAMPRALMLLPDCLRKTMATTVLSIR